jgi:hypothetical protein
MYISDSKAFGWLQIACGRFWSISGSRDEDASRVKLTPALTSRSPPPEIRATRGCHHQKISLQNDLP